MSTEVKNPQAFPYGMESSNEGSSFYEAGMSLRDYFAAKAMQVMMNCEPFKVDDGYIASTAYGEIAKQSYEMADAMLNERNKNIE